VLRTLSAVTAKLQPALTSLAHSAFQLLRRHGLDQLRIADLVVGTEQVARDLAAAGDIGVDADEFDQNAAVVVADLQRLLDVVILDAGNAAAAFGEKPPGCRPAPCGPAPA
jgi:hypothetical protein